MPTQEERLAALEQEIRIAFQDTNHALTMLKGVIGSQGQDIKRIMQDIEKLVQGQEVLVIGQEGTNAHLARLETLLSQIFARLPEKL